jgi:DDE family transposase
MYYPRMYLTHCYDVLSGVTKDFKHHHLLDEITDAEEMIPSLEKDSLSLYDRLFLSGRIIRAHKAAKNYFLARCSKASFLAIQNFFESSKTHATTKIEGVTIHLIKVHPPENKEPLVFATNLPESWTTEELIAHLYALRWEVEVSFKDLLETMKIEQWHSKSLNGILQELYTAFWLMNYVKIQMVVENKKPLKVLESSYFKPNFKVMFNFIVDLLPRLFQRFRDVFAKFPLLLKLCTVKRKRFSRRYKRELKTSASPYPYNNTVWVHDS